MVSGDGTSGTALAYLTHVDALILAEDSRMELVGPRDSALEYLARFTATPQGRVWNLQRILSVHQVRLGSRLNARSRAQGTDLRLVVPRRALLRSPLHGCVEDPIRVGPVPGPLLVMDAVAFFAGPYGTPVAETFWQTRDPELVERATQAFLEVWDTAVPVAEHQSRDPIGDRTREVALALLDGASDREIAAELGVSERTVSAEVHRVVEWLGARSRGHAIAILVGAGG